MQSSTGNDGYDSYDSQPEDLTIETSEPPSHHTFPPVSFQFHTTFPDVYLPPSIPNQTTASTFVPFPFLDSHVEAEVPEVLTLGNTHTSEDLLTTQTPSASITSLKSSTVPNTGAGDGGPSAASLTAAQLHMTAMSKTVGWEPDEEPLYVNAKQYHRIMKRREMRAKLEATGKIPKKRKKYLYESRHKHAMARTRGNGGKFSKEN
ncbi:transcriptional activator HAP2-like isoform X3 [Branchiostoma floridae]|uniref:Nuclear transcription factor Y subunit n=1 Tax=Branchiostoma floridae TaxID=7739 RepID=A0A9J7MMC5_BRAFL|nr:transcriptional activator HAP2-like isoform X3 [Branchiostoma floridae]